MAKKVIVKKGRPAKVPVKGAKKVAPVTAPVKGAKPVIPVGGKNIPAPAGHPGGKLKKGSPEAKAFMARMRGKKGKAKKPVTKGK